MKNIVTPEREPHLSSEGVYAMVSNRYGDCEITDGCAMTIASWYQTPAGSGATFATLACGLPVDVDDLSGAIAYEYAMAEPRERKCLDMLSTWSLNHPSLTA